MGNQKDYITEDRISLRELVNQIQALFYHLLSIRKKVIIVGLLITGLYVTYHTIRRPVYLAETTFVLEIPSSQELGQFSSLTSTLGLSVPGLDENSLFQSDNIIELYKSRRMLSETFLSYMDNNGTRERLITRFAREKKLLPKWRKAVDDPDFTFEVPDQELNIKHDSLLFEVIEDFRDDQLIVEKPDRKLSILSARITDKDQEFAKTYNEILVKRVNQFYLKTKTKKSAENLRVLTKQSDSVKLILDEGLARLATIIESIPNPNPSFRSSQVPVQKLRIEVESNATIYEELVKNLELAKIAHRNSTPLIQIIDEPILPLPTDKDRFLKTFVLGIFVAGFITLGYFTLLYVFNKAMKIED